MKKPLVFIIFPILLLFTVPVVLGLAAYKPDIHKAPFFIAKNNSISIPVLDCNTGKIRKTDLEDYIPGVVSAEMPALFHPEALKAQAVAARSYILSKLNSPPTQHPDAAVCNDPSHCKAYISKTDAKKQWEADKADLYYQKISDCCNATKGEYMAYQEEAIEAFFFSQSGGRTENARDVWGKDLPYLKSVESTENPPQPSATVSIPFGELRKNLGLKPNAAPPQIGKITRTDGGSVNTIEIDSISFKGTKIRSLFNLRSANFTVSLSDTDVIFTTVGYGHGVGMSQYGANEMAKNGKNYTEILSHYYTNIQIMKL